jgi:hypothetical protein
MTDGGSTWRCAESGHDIDQHTTLILPVHPTSTASTRCSFSTGSGTSSLSWVCGRFSLSAVEISTTEPRLTRSLAQECEDPLPRSR